MTYVNCECPLCKIPKGTRVCKKVVFIADRGRMPIPIMEDHQMSGTTSFQRLAPKTIKIPGTKVSINNSQLLTSCGVPSLDSVIGGGIPVGTVVLLEEDAFSCYSNILLKCYLAEGALSGHGLYLASLACNPREILNNLPGVATEGDKLRTVEDGDPLKIAWQYQNMPVFRPSSHTGQLGHNFDLSKTMDKQLVNNTKPRIYDDSIIPQTKVTNANGEAQAKLLPLGGVMSPYDELIRSVYQHIEKEGFTTTVSEKSTILRIALQSVGSADWEDNTHTDEVESVATFCQFLFRLRAVLRYSLATCFLTAPMHLFHDPAAVSRIEKMCDTVLRLESFAGSTKETNPIFKDYQGLFHIIKLPALNSLHSQRPVAIDYAFKLRRKRFIVEVLHLPPELPETKKQRKEDLPFGSSTSCSQIRGTRNSLDF